MTTMNMEIGLCDKFMGKRCAVNWDSYCDYFLLNGETDTGGFNHLNTNFLNTAAKEKFCRAATDAPGAQCALQCEPFDPTAQASPQICKWAGTPVVDGHKNRDGFGRKLSSDASPQSYFAGIYGSLPHGL